MSVGRRLVEERERLGMTQGAFFAACGVSKAAQYNFESDINLPGGAYLIAAAALGVDIAYVLTGQRSPSMPATDPAEQVLLDSYRRCGAQARQNLIQTAVLLSAGISAGVPTGAQPASVKVSSKHGHAAGRDVNVNTEGSVNGKQGNLKPRGARSGT